MNPVSTSIKPSTGGILSFEDLEAFRDRNAPVATMFSGGLDSTYLLYKLQSLGFSNIEAVAADVGTSIDKPLLEQTAARFGARFVCLEGREAFVEQGVKPAIRAHAKYLGNYPLSSSLSRPVIASLIVDHATSIGSRLLLHTASLSQNSLPRLNNSIKRSGFSGNFGSPYECSVISRQQKAAALSKFGLTFVTDRTWSGDENLWCREFESGPLEDPENFSIPEEAFDWTRNTAAEQPVEIKLGFIDGNLVSIDDRDVALIDTIPLLNKTVGKFGHGRFVGLEHISTGEKVLEVREAPAAAIIMDALRHLETASLGVGSIVLKEGLEQAWSQEAVSGEWGSTIHKMCERAIASALEGVSGSVSYIVDNTRFLPRSIIASTPKYITDRHLWEHQAASHQASFKTSPSLNYQDGRHP
ncbi:argininosuccinate synthase-related protein [Mesorhizobium sp. M0048]|uniref:argininosuccinate synthase-related protein n=1 Tax=Mesorhizobium sp. M0048 TaxID=2956860 RepID=UPI003337EB11